MNTLTDHGKHQTERLAMHVGLMAVLLQRGAPVTLVQSQCVSLRGMLKEILDLEEPGDAIMQVDHLLDEGIAELLCEGTSAPDDLSSLDDPEEEPNP